MRYTGTTAGGDRGVLLHRSILSFGVRHELPSGQDLEAARAAIRPTGPPVELRPLPISRLDAVLNYTPVGGEPEEPKALPAGHFEAPADNGRSTSTTYWQERTYTLGLDEATSQIFWSALQKGQLVLSLGYAFYATGLGSEAPLDELKGSPELVKSLQDEFAKGPEAPAEGVLHLVRADAVAITVDYAKWPDLFVRTDLNESIPPGYAVLEVRCYDFNNALRPDLSEKDVEFQAEGVTGKTATLLTVFEADQADLCARYLRFPLAVRLDRPYRYATTTSTTVRSVTGVTRDGDEQVGAWIERPSWAQLLDVTSPPPAEPKAGAGEGH